MTDRSPQSRGIAALLILLFLVVAAIVLFESSEPTPGATRSSAPAIAEPSATGAAATSTGEARRRAIEVTPSPTAAAETAALRVVVAFKAGGPVVGRGVIATRLRPGRARQSRRATTDANGHSLFLDLATGTWNVQVPGSGPQQVELVAGATSEVRVTLRRGVAIAGRVIDAFDRPVAGATLFAMPGSNLDHDDAAPIGISTAAGRFRLEGYSLPVSTWIAARAEGHGAAPWRFVLATGEADLPALTDIELRLGAGRASLRGRCLDGQGRACAGVGVRLAPVGIAAENRSGIRTWSGHEYETVTPADGGFLFRDLAVATWRATVIADGLWFEPREVVIRSDTDSAVIELIATTAAMIAGNVTDERDRPIDSAFVRIREVPWARSAVDEAGSFALSDLPPRRLELRAFADGFDDLVQELDLHPGSNPIRLTMSRSPRFIGIARAADGTPLAGWRVGGIPEGADHPAGETETDTDGRFEFAVDERVPHRFCVTAAGTFFRSRLDDLGAFVPSSNPVDLVVPASAVAEATLVGRLPRAGEDKLYLLTIRDGQRQIQASEFGDGAHDASTGEFRLGPLPAGEYSLVVAARRRVAGTWGFSVVGESVFGPFALAGAETRDVGLLSLPEPGRMQITFTVAGGCEPRNVKLEWHSVASATSGLVGLDVDGPSTYDVIPGEYDVTIWGEGFLAVERRIHVPPPPAAVASVDVTLEPGQRLPLELSLPVGETRATFVVRHRSGRLAFEDEFGTDEAQQVQRWPVLGLGTHLVEALGGSGRRYRGGFVVESLTPTADAITFDLQPER